MSKYRNHRGFFLCRFKIKASSELIYFRLYILNFSLLVSLESQSHIGATVGGPWKFYLQEKIYLLNITRLVASVVPDNVKCKYCDSGKLLWVGGEQHFLGDWHLT